MHFLPFESEDEYIQSIEYLPAELVPETPLEKNSIIDVRCKYARGRQFIVEMQMFWSKEFKYRVLFNASKAYVKQLDNANKYNLLQPVYSLNLVNEIYEPDNDIYYHDYKIVETGQPANVINGLRFIFIELPKFTPYTFSEKRMKVLWLRYLTEIDERTRDIPEEMMKNLDIRKAVEQIEESAFTPAQMESYDKFGDIVRTENTLIVGAERRGMAKGEQNKAIDMARKLKLAGVDLNVIASFSGLTIE